MNAHNKEMVTERERDRERDMTDKITSKWPISTLTLSNINIMCTTYVILTFLVATVNENEETGEIF